MTSVETSRSPADQPTYQVPVRVAYDHHIGPVEKRRASGIEIWKELEECRSKSTKVVLVGQRRVSQGRSKEHLWWLRQRGDRSAASGSRNVEPSFTTY